MQPLFHAKMSQVMSTALLSGCNENEAVLRASRVASEAAAGIASISEEEKSFTSRVGQPKPPCIPVSSSFRAHGLLASLC